MVLLKMRFFFMVSAVVTAFLVFGQASKTESLSFGAPHPDAPAELAELAFVIGEWKLDTWFAQKDGSKQKGSATLEGRYVLDGFGIEMISRYPRADGSNFLATKTMVYNHILKKWIGSGINTLGNRKDYQGQLEAGKLVILQTGMQFQGNPGINRVTYFDISENAFSLRYDYSPDDGKTWNEGTFGFTATRVR